MGEMSAIWNLKLSLSRLGVACVDKGSFGLHFVRCFIFWTHEEVVTDHFRLSKDKVEVLDTRE